MASNRIKSEYIKAKGENKFLKVELYYDLGGINYFTYKNEPRGYYLSVCPVERIVHDGYISEGFTMFSGVKALIHECGRKGKGAEQKALTQYESRKAELLQRFSDMIADPA